MLAIIATSVLAAAAAAAPPITQDPQNIAHARTEVAQVYDIRDYGSRGDGTSEDTSAIQSAVDLAAANGGAVHVPAGRYLTGPIALPSNITLYGDGVASVLILQGGARSHLLSPKDRATVASVENVTIRDLKLLGNSALQNKGGPMPGWGGKHGVAILGGKNWLVQNVVAEDFDGDGVYLGRNFENPANMPAQGNTVTNCTVTRNIRNGMMISHGIGNVLKNNLFEGNQLGVVPGHPKFKRSVYASAELDIEPNTFRFSERASNNIIEGNTFRNGNWVGIQITRPSTQIAGNIIRYNTFIDNKGGQILLRSPNAIHNLIAHNRFVASSPSVMPFVIRIANGSYNRIVDNVFIGGVEDTDKNHAITFDNPGHSLRARLLHIFDNPGLWMRTQALHNEFSGNHVDFRNATGNGATIYFDSMEKDSIISGNTLIHAELDMRGTTLTAGAQ